MSVRLSRADRIGLLRPALDAHTLGISNLEQLLKECGYSCVVADAPVCRAVLSLTARHSAARLERWILDNGIHVLGFSYRLDPQKGADLAEELVTFLKQRRLLHEDNGPLKAFYFAGLPETCGIVRRRVPGIAAVFSGDETPDETLRALGVSPRDIPGSLVEQSSYDRSRLDFGREIVRKADYLGFTPLDRSGYPSFGDTADTVVHRLAHGTEHGLPPLVRAHVGPYLPDRNEAVKLFLDWTRELAHGGYLDVLSVGSSQLTQSNFGEDWGDAPNGGGVPLNSAEEFAALWAAARPMLVRTYAGTRAIADLARMYEQTIHMAWHALSLWWFCRVDGRGPYTVRENLRQHVAALKYIATTGKPFEANVSHHFAFRGADDVTCIVSAFLGAKLAKSLGIRHFILQNMLNTPKLTWGVQDLAKSRATLQLVRELEDGQFRVILQPRGGLDYFSSDIEKAKAQLAAVTALMDDIEPHDPTSPPIIHVVSYSEARHLATPAIINESIQITQHSLREYRRLRRKGQVDDMARNAEVLRRTDELLHESRQLIGAIERMIPKSYAAEGLYKVMSWGFFPLPYLWECREEFCNAACWQTRPVRGGVRLVDTNGQAIPADIRIAQVAALNARELVTERA